MEKKFKFSENPTVAKTVYGVIIALLCITAIVIGIVAANSRKTPTPSPDEQNPPVDDGSGSGSGEGDGNQNEGNEGGGENETEKKPVVFISPVTGKVMKAHSTSIPVYSETLEEWRIHTGIDISTAEGADVFAAAAGEVTKVYSNPMLGQTVEITHSDGSITRYSNLSKDGITKQGTKVESGTKIGVIGDTAISEIADEAHLHFEMFVNEASVNPLDYMSEDAKKVSLGITGEESES